MTHPTSTPPPVGLVPLSDAEAPDFLERHRVAVLAFVDATTEASRKLRERLERVALEFTDRAAFGVLDVRTDALVAGAVGVKAVPEVFVFVDGQNLDHVAGVAPETILRETVAARVQFLG